MLRNFEVVEPAASRLLTTIATAKTRLGNLVASMPDDDLRGYIAGASSLVSKYTARVYARERLRETHSGACGPIYLARYPVAEIVELKEGGTLIEPELYEVMKSTGRLIRLDAAGEQTNWSGRLLVVTYDAGFVLPYVPSDPVDPDALPRDLPEDLEDAAIEIVRTAVTSRDRDPMLQSQSATGIGSVTYAIGSAGTANDGLPDLARTLLSAYRSIDSLGIGV